MHTSKFYGYSPRTMEAKKIVTGNRRTNVRTLGALTVNGIIASKTVIGAFNRERFVDFLNAN